MIDNPSITLTNFLSLLLSIILKEVYPKSIPPNVSPYITKAFPIPEATLNLWSNKPVNICATKTINIKKAHGIFFNDSTSFLLIRIDKKKARTNIRGADSLYETSKPYGRKVIATRKVNKRDCPSLNNIAIEKMKQIIVNTIYIF